MKNLEAAHLALHHMKTLLEHGALSALCHEFQQTQEREQYITALQTALDQLGGKRKDDFMNLQKFLREEVLTLRARVEALEERVLKPVNAACSTVTVTPEAVTATVSGSCTDDIAAAGEAPMDAGPSFLPRWRVSWDDYDGSRREALFCSAANAAAEAILRVTEDYDNVSMEGIPEGGRADAQEKG